MKKIEKILISCSTSLGVVGVAAVGVGSIISKKLNFNKNEGFIEMITTKEKAKIGESIQIKTKLHNINPKNNLIFTWYINSKKTTEITGDIAKVTSNTPGDINYELIIFDKTSNKIYKGEIKVTWIKEKLSITNLNLLKAHWMQIINSEINSEFKMHWQKKDIENKLINKLNESLVLYNVSNKVINISLNLTKGEFGLKEANVEILFENELENEFDDELFKKIDNMLTLNNSIETGIYNNVDENDTLILSQEILKRIDSLFNKYLMSQYNYNYSNIEYGVGGHDTFLKNLKEINNDLFDMPKITRILSKNNSFQKPMHGYKTICINFEFGDFVRNGGKIEIKENSFNYSIQNKNVITSNIKKTKIRVPNIEKYEGDIIEIVQNEINDINFRTNNILKIKNNIRERINVLLKKENIGVAKISDLVFMNDDECETKNVMIEIEFDDQIIGNLNKFTINNWKTLKSEMIQTKIPKLVNQNGELIIDEMLVNQIDLLINKYVVPKFQSYDNNSIAMCLGGWNQYYKILKELNDSRPKGLPEISAISKWGNIIIEEWLGYKYVHLTLEFNDFANMGGLIVLNENSKMYQLGSYKNMQYLITNKKDISSK